MRTEIEIAQRLEELKQKPEEDCLGFKTEVLIPYLTLNTAQEVFKGKIDFTEKLINEWECEELTEENVTNELKAYISFAFKKCVDHRGISAGRSVEKLETWAWMLGRDDLVKFKKTVGNYAQYGAPIVKKFAEEFNVELPKSEAFENMARGEHCGADYECGCEL